MVFVDLSKCVMLLTGLREAVAQREKEKSAEEKRIQEKLRVFLSPYFIACDCLLLLLE